MSDLLPLQCKDLAFARNLIAQMKKGHGRHNSNQQFNRDRCQQQAAPDRVIGRADWIKRDPSKCAIGDVTDYFLLQDCPWTWGWRSFPIVKYLPPRIPLHRFNETLARCETVETWTFERVRLHTVEEGIRVLWKRIE